jgi:Ca2+-binding RTX toxin-like protein
LAGEGRDRLDFASLTVSDPLTLDLKNDTTLAAHLNRTIRTGGTGQSTNFEDATGGSGNDTLTGSALFNILIGNAGNDVLNGGEGSDNLIGGTGNDTYIFGTAFSVQTDTITELNGGGTDRIDFSTLLMGDNLNVNFAAQNFATHTNRIVRATDANQLNFFEDVFGGAGNDVLVGNTANNVLSGGDGNDTLIGLTGNDAYVFATTSADQIDSIVESASGGTDLLDFSALGYNDPVIVNLLGGSTTVATHAHRVVQVSAVVGAAQFENVLGGDGDDTLTGNAGVNTLTGGAGNDRLAGGTGNDTYVFDADLILGSDTIDEAVGAGSDLLSFTLTTTTPVTMSLGTLGSQVVVAGKLSIELLSDAVIENITAGTQGGTFTGNSLANILTGGAGSDTLNGGNGDDLLIGNAGNDILNGGLQNDVYQFDVDLVLGSDTINDTLGVDALDFALTTTVGITLDLAVTSLQALHATNLSLTLSVGTVIETVLGTAKDDTIRGNDADNILVGNAGNDVLQGRAGRDILIGGLGADTLDGGANDDILIGGKTTSDAVINKLNDIRTEWISANWYGIRLANLRAGVGASNTSLKAKVNVTNDATSGSVDTLTGGSDEDWYFKAVDDIVTDLFAGEFLDLL